MATWREAKVSSGKCIFFYLEKKKQKKEHRNIFTN
jgi:hypothetical protein